MVPVEGTPIECIPQYWEKGLDKVGLLGLINMPLFGQRTEVNARMKQMLACFYGGYLWLDDLVAFTMELISEIMGIPKYGPDPSQYI